jgi:hypothetical protein
MNTQAWATISGLMILATMWSVFITDLVWHTYEYNLIIGATFLALTVFAILKYASKP